MDAARITKIVRKNFDDSADAYSVFENGTSLFAGLAHRLASFCRIKPGMTVLDIGCGTGASARALHGIVAPGKVVGIDGSARMLDAALRVNVPEIDYIQADAGRLPFRPGGRFDAVLYNAAIFLVPEPRRALEEAKKVLRRGGVCGASILLSLCKNRIDILQDAHKNGICGDGRFVADKDICSGFEAVFSDFKTATCEILVDYQSAAEFYTIPAQSASLFPGIPYAERKKRIETLFSSILRRNEDYSLLWLLIMGIQTETE